MKDKKLTISELNLKVQIDENTYYKKNPKFFMDLIQLICEHPAKYSLILNAKGRKREPDIIPRYKYLNDWINEITKFKLADQFFNTPTKCYWIINDLQDFPVCKECGNQEYFKHYNVSIFIGYPSFCSKVCIQNNIDVKNSREQTNLARRSVKNPFQAEDVKQKIGDTKALLHNGNRTFTNPEKISATKKKHKEADPLYAEKIQQKYEETCLRLFGVKNPMQNVDIQQKQLKTYQENMLANYGVISPWSLPEVQQKCEETCEILYGVRRPMQNSAIRCSGQKHYMYDGKNFDSKPELAFYIWLVDNGFKFEYQPSVHFNYTVNGITHFYCPDFKVMYNGIEKLVELKGDQFIKADGTWQCPYDHTLDSIYEAKHQCVLQNNIIVFTSKDYQQYIDYVIDTYGENYLQTFRNK